jgi:S-adenosylmethionine:tRNA ribosyltransferase-isomerase
LKAAHPAMASPRDLWQPLRLMTLRTSDFDYPLPEALIASHPPERREDARMLVVHRSEGRWEHRRIADLPEYIRPGDLAVFNDTRVIPARVYSDDGRLELLLLEAEGPATWRCLVKPGRKLRVGAEFKAGGVTGIVQEVFPDGDRLIAFDAPLDLQRVGELPLPPYMGRAAELEDKERYQTIYAREEGSVAAPTAGLHFTPELMASLPHAFVTLHVGTGTFRSVLTETLEDHPMHSERYDLPEVTALKINAAQRVLAIGTTTARVLESCALHGVPLKGASGRTDLFIKPPHTFRCIGALLTNFHLPKSTLLVLVSAFAGRELTLAAYAEAVRESYRFYSYGDCMLVI